MCIYKHFGHVAFCFESLFGCRMLASLIHMCGGVTSVDTPSVFS